MIGGTGVSGCVEEGTGTVVTGGTVCNPGALAGGSCVGDGVIGTGGTNENGAGVNGLCIVIGIGAPVEVGGC